MGRSYTPRYRVEFLTDSGAWTPQGWKPSNGMPNAKNLHAFVKVQEQATQPGGVNAHIGATKIVAARIVTNTGEAKLVAAYAANTEVSPRAINWIVSNVSVPALGLDVAYGEEPKS